MSQNRRAGSENFSPSLTCNNKKSSISKHLSSTVEPLSNYFIKKSVETEKCLKIKEIPIETFEEPIEDMNFKFENFDSPYKNLIKTDTKINLNDSTSDAADFRSPFPTRKPGNSKTGLNKYPVKKTRSKKKTSSKNVQSIKPRSLTTSNKNVAVNTDHFKYFGENPEHIQMAMALSMSTYEAECGTTCPLPEDQSNISEILRAVKPSFLEKFGFTTTGKSRLPVGNRRAKTVPSEAPVRTKGRFKFITPILSIRTNKERKSLIDHQISLILCQKNPDVKEPYTQIIHNSTLNKYNSKERSIFNLDNIYEKNNFYVKNLDIPKNVYKCGNLLKDWTTISGRDKSPCQRVKNVTTEEESGNYKKQDTNQSFDTNYNLRTDGVVEPIKETTFSAVSPECENVTKEYSLYKVLPAKHLSATPSLEVSCTFDVPSKSQKIILGSFNSQSKDSEITSSYASSAKRSVHSFSSSGRSISPDLFDSDDETDHLLNNSQNNLPEILSSPKKLIDIVMDQSPLDDNNKATEEYMHDSFKNSVIKFGDCLDANQIELINSVEENSGKSPLPIEIIDLTDNTESELNSSPKSLLSISKINSENNDCYVTSEISNEIKKRKTNIYNLDEFEDQRTYQHDECDFQISFAVKERNNPNSITDEIANDNKNTFNFKEIANASVNSDTSNSSNSLSNNNDNPCTSVSVNTKSCSYAQEMDDSMPDCDFINDFDKEEVKKQSGSSNDTPKRDQGCKRPSSFYDDVSDSKNDTRLSNDTDIERNIHVSINTTNSSLEDTPKLSCKRKIMKSPCFDEPLFCEPTDLNVTDYVNNMLSQDNFSFDKVNTVNDNECKGEGPHIVNNDNDMSLSQCSQNSVILDDELNYSCHFATPLRSNQHAENSSNDGNKNLDDVTPPSADYHQHIDLETLPLQNSLGINSEIVPKTTIMEHIWTPDNVIIKTINVTPMPRYDTMTTPLINRELQKVGVKPLKRTRGAKLLQYIYESTHPFAGSQQNVVQDNAESDEDIRTIKRSKKRDERQSNLECNSLVSSNSSISSDPKWGLSVEIIGDRIIEHEKPEDLIFERRRSVKIPSCKVPLQIVWYNLVSSHPAIKEDILLYEPLQLESLHIMLKEQGFKFHIQDLLTFLDKKCITIRTTQRQGKMPM